MKLVALDLPDNANEWPSWLEHQLVGLQLRDLVRQLEVVGVVSPQNAVSLDTLLGNQRGKILRDGLSVLSQAQLQSLVANPRSLLELQELVLQEGCPYWQRLSRTSEHQQQVSDQWLRIQAAIETRSGNVPPANVPGKQVDPQRQHWTRWVAVAIALAACLLFVIFAWQNGGKEQGKFFARKGLLQSPKVGGAFLREVASVIQTDWQSDINDAALLKAELEKVVAACDLFIKSDLPQLNPATRQEAKKRCQGWRDKFRVNLTDLASGKPFVEVRTDANATVERLIKVLNELEA
jgi:hypothetical protein